jgi:hypothetical protein
MFVLHPSVRWPSIRLGIALIASICLHAWLISDVNVWRIRAPLESVISNGETADAASDQPLRAELVERQSTPLLVAPAEKAAAPPQTSHASLAGAHNNVPATPADMPQTKPQTARAPQTVDGSAHQADKPSPTHYFGPGEYDVRAHPMNPPNVDQFKDEVYGDQTVRLRVYVDGSGHVDRAEALPETDADPTFVQHMIEAIDSTAFAPAELKGEFVASYFDVDLSIRTSHGPIKIVR